MDWNMEPGHCPGCGSGNVVLTAFERGWNVLLWNRCRDCDSEFLECYSLESKGLEHRVGEDEDEED